MKCPFCDEEIQEGAAKCRFCREWITAPIRDHAVANSPQTHDTKSFNAAADALPVDSSASRPSDSTWDPSQSPTTWAPPGNPFDSKDSAVDGPATPTRTNKNDCAKPCIVAEKSEQDSTVRELKLHPLIRIPLHLFTAWMVGSFVAIFTYSAGPEVGGVTSLVAMIVAFWHFQRKPYSYAFACPGCGEAKELSAAQMSRLRQTKEPAQCSVCSATATILDNGGDLVVRGETLPELFPSASTTSAEAPRWSKPSRALAFLLLVVPVSLVFIALLSSGRDKGSRTPVISGVQPKSNEASRPRDDTDYAKVLKQKRQAVGDWVQYRSQDRSFQILLPVQPEVLKDQDGQLVLRSVAPDLKVVVLRNTQLRDNSTVPAGELSREAVKRLREFAAESGGRVTASSEYEKLPGGRVDVIKDGEKVVMILQFSGRHVYNICFGFPANTTSEEKIEEKIKWCLVSLKMEKD